MSWSNLVAKIGGEGEAEDRPDTVIPFGDYLKIKIKEREGI